MRFIMSLVSKAIGLGTVATLLALLAPTRAEAVVVNWKFGLVGVVFDADQAVQVNATHIGDPNTAPAPCATLVEFFDGATGVSFKTDKFIVSSGETRSTDLGVKELILLKGKVSIYARVTVDDPNLKPACRPSLEVFDKVSGRTVVAYGDPDQKGATETFFPALTLAGQAIRVNAVNMDDPKLAPCPVLLTVLAADGKTTLGQQRTILAPGAGTSLDVAFGDPNQRVLLRAAGERIVANGAAKTLCRAFVFSVEVYDLATGITTLLVQPPEPD